MHPGKTKILSNKPKRTAAESQRHVQIFGDKVEILPLEGQTKYLGRMVTFCDPHGTEIAHRMKKAWGAFHANKGIICNRAHPLKHRLHVFNSVVTPTALHGAGSWTLNCNSEAILRRTQRQMLRSILQERRRHTKPLDEDTESTNTAMTASSHTHEDLEPWHEWIKRATDKVENYSR